jgi:predicted acyltransferase
LHFWDLIQPGFMFMAGISMAYSLTKQTSENVSWKQQFKKLLTRCFLLVFWGIFKRIGNPEWLSLQNLDVTDILTQLAFASMIAFLLFNLKIRYQLVACLGILILTDLLYRFCSIVGFSGGYTDGENFGDYMDWVLFGKKTMGYVFINWFPTAVHTIAGTIVGKLFIQNNMQLKHLLFSGLGLVILGYGLDFLDIIPIIKPIATASFVMASLGFCFFGVALCYWWIDAKRHQKGLIFCYVFGINSIFIYLFSDIVGRKWFNGYTTMEESPLLKIFGIGEDVLLIIASLCIFMAEWGMCYFLYKKKLFFKL